MAEGIPFEVDVSGVFLVNDPVSRADTSSDLDVQVRALGEELTIDARVCVASGHHHRSVWTNHGGVLVVAVRKSLAIAGVVGIDLGLDDVCCGSHHRLDHERPLIGRVGRAHSA
jgi:hypothetical protein